MGLLSYSGSTVPGMSGAAYIKNKEVYGMHMGATCDENVGVAAVIIYRELREIVLGESKKNRAVRFGSVDDEYLPAEKMSNFIGKNTCNWNLKDIDAAMAAVKNNDKEWKCGFSWAEDIEEEKACSLDAAADLLQQMPEALKKNVTMLIKGQSPDGKKTLVEEDICSQRFSKVTNELRAVKARLLKLEKASQEVKLVAKEVKPMVVKGEKAESKPKGGDKVVKPKAEQKPEAEPVGKSDVAPVEDVAESKNGKRHRKSTSRVKNPRNGFKYVSQFQLMRIRLALLAQEAGAISTNQRDLLLRNGYDFEKKEFPWRNLQKISESLVGPKRNGQPMTSQEGSTGN